MHELNVSGFFLYIYFFFTFLNDSIHKKASNRSCSLTEKLVHVTRNTGSWTMVHRRLWWVQIIRLRYVLKISYQTYLQCLSVTYALDTILIETELRQLWILMYSTTKQWNKQLDGIQFHNVVKSFQSHNQLNPSYHSINWHKYENAETNKMEEW